MRYLLCILLSIPIISYSQTDQLRAVIIVGDQQDGTINAIEDMENIHAFFKSGRTLVEHFAFKVVKMGLNMVVIKS